MAVQTASKKRKLQSPPLPSIKDAQQYREKLPILVDRLVRTVSGLYGASESWRMRGRYAATRKEIVEIERGEWDERILMEEKAMTNGTSAGEGTRPKVNGTPAEPLSQENKYNQASCPAPVDRIPANAPPLQSPRSEGLAISDVLNNQEPAARSPNLSGPPQNGHYPPQTHQRVGSNGPHGPSPLQGPQQQGVLRWETPIYGPQAPPYQPGGAYPQFNSPQYHPQHPQTPQNYQPQRSSFSSPHGLPPISSSPHPSPILLPPLNAVRMSPTSPGLPLDALADVAGQHPYRATSGSPIMQQPAHMGYPAPFSPHQRPPSANGPQWTHNQQHMLPYNGHQQPPYPPTQQRTPFAPPSGLMSQNPQYTSPYNPGQAQRQTLLNQNSAPRPRPSGPFTPVGNLNYRITGSGTKWTPVPTGLTPRAVMGPLPSPAMEPLSPVLRQAEEVPEKVRKPPKKQTQPVEPPKPSNAPKRGGQRGRAGSTASSVIADSHRSQSVMSHTDELSIEIGNRHVKEEVATPRGVEDIGDTTADESTNVSRFASRAGPFPRQSTKRKRASSIGVEPRPQTGPPTVVMWTRNFPKISTSALEAITGHKNASTFAFPVKERDAPGYKDLILRPQDLKSIKSAIVAGQRAAAAAAPDDINPNAASVLLPISEDLIPPKGIINYAQLEKELMRMFANAIMFNSDPDRGFGRKWEGIGKDKGEVVGYEIDEDGVVKETRAMFNDVERIVTNLRSAEKRSEQLREDSMARHDGADDEDELAGEAEAETHARNSGNTGSVKRRRKA
jgi:hypothetical protein